MPVYNRHTYNKKTGYWNQDTILKYLILERSIFFEIRTSGYENPLDTLEKILS